MSDHIKDEGCWIIQQVNALEPWKGTKKSPFKQHTFYPVPDDTKEDGLDWTKLRCSTCGMVQSRDGKVLSVVTPELDPEREPTITELKGKSL